MYFSKNPKSLMTNDLRDLHDHFQKRAFGLNWQGVIQDARVKKYK